MTENVITNEIWKNIEDFPDYQVSNIGRVRSLKYGKERILKTRLCGGYLSVDLHNSKGCKTCAIHRLVANVFIQNPNNFPIINHKNEIKSDNRVENLEWCTYKYNNNYGMIRQKMSEAKKGKKHSLETRQKISKARKGRTPMLGHKHSLETRKKISETEKGKHVSQETRQKMSLSIKLYWENKNAQSNISKCNS